MVHHLLEHLTTDWQRAVGNVRAAAANVWERPAFRHAVDHGPAHADRIVALLDGLTEGLMARQEHALAQEEIYILLAAVYLHAIGLQDEKTEPDPAMRWTNYPALGAELVYRAIESPEDAVRLGLVDDPGLLEVIALAVAGHREMDYPASEYDNFLLGSATVRPRLLTALLHLADDLDLDSRRVNLEQLKLLAATPEQALDWWLHHYVSGVQVTDEYVRVGYRIPQNQPDYEALLPELVETHLHAGFDALRDTFRLYGVKVDIAPPSAVRPMRAVRPMPPAVWAAAEARLAALRGDAPAPVATLHPLVETVRGLLATMGYDCDAPACDNGPLTCFTCQPRSRGLRPPLLVGCKIGDPAAVPDVEALAARLTAEMQGYLIAENRVLHSARQAAQAGGGRVRVFVQAGFYRELLDFSPYVQRLVDDYVSSELARIYVDLGAVRYSYDGRGQVVGKDHTKPLDDYVDAWLRERGSERNHISILGDYGTGKTSFCRQYAAKLGRRWLADPDRERIPLLINLREYTKTLKMESLITDALVNQYGIQGATFDAFMRYNADGKLLIFLDGFDEMAQRTGARTAVDNFWELARAVVPGSKVILTCRTPYFRTHHEAEALLHGQWLADVEGVAPFPTDDGQQTAGIPESPVAGHPSPVEYIDLHDRPNFEIVHLDPFTDDDIQAVLRKRFPEQWQAHWAQIQNVYNLPDLARRPVLLDMITRTLPELREGQTVNAARLYRVYTDLWLERDVGKGRTLLTPEQRRFFAEELAMAMLRTEELALHYSRIPSQVAQYFKLDKAEDIDYFEADVRTCNFLNHDGEGNYAFAHKSFMEFFAACRLHRLMLEDRATANGPVRINEEIRLFLNNLFALHPKTEPGPPEVPPDGFVWVPPGEYVLGEKGELPLQITRLEQGFFVAKTPVTNAQYACFVAETGQSPPKHWEGKTPPSKLAQHPVVYVSWEDAVAYAEWAGCRLPSEQEWEKAARGVDGRAYPWGDGFDKNKCNTSESDIRTTTPVGQYAPQGLSPWGAMDMAGNVWEWTSSEVGSARVLRGGAFDSYRDYARCASRHWYPPYHRYRHVGFRVVVSPSD